MKIAIRRRWLNRTIKCAERFYEAQEMSSNFAREHSDSVRSARYTDVAYNLNNSFIKLRKCEKKLYGITI